MGDRLHRRACALAALLLAASCSGGGTSRAVSLPPAGGPAVSGADAQAIQAALLAEQAAVLLAPFGGGPSLLGGRRAAGARATRDVGCNGGYSEQDTANGQSVHVVQSFYFDPGCTALRQRATLDRNSGVDTSASTGTIVSYDTAGNVTVTQGVDRSSFASGGGFLSRRSTDAAGTDSTQFGRAALSCSNTMAIAACTLAAVVGTSSRDVGAVLSTTLVLMPPNQIFASTTLAFTGSLRSGQHGSLAIGGSPPGVIGGDASGTAVSGTLRVLQSTDGPSEFAIALDAAGTHVDGALANGITTFRATAGAVATVNQNGDGEIHSPGGPSERILDYRLGV